MTTFQTRSDVSVDPLDLLTMKQVSDKTGIPVGTLQHYRLHRTGPRSAKVGNRVFYRRVDVESWIEEQFAASDGGVA